MILLASNGEINDVADEKQFRLEISIYCLENSYLRFFYCLGWKVEIDYTYNSSIMSRV